MFLEFRTSKGTIGTVIRSLRCLSVYAAYFLRIYGTKKLKFGSYYIELGNL